jgi:hypothetical protein
MTRLYRLPRALALGSIVLAVSVGMAHARTVTVQNCIDQGSSQTFMSYDQDDLITASAASNPSIAYRSSRTLDCVGSNYCKVRAMVVTAPLHHVSVSATFYTRSTVNDFIDADCSQAP